MFGIEGEVIIALIVFVIFFMMFGSKRMPEVSRSIGESMRELRKGFSGDDDKKDTKTDSQPESK